MKKRGFILLTLLPLTVFAVTKVKPLYTSSTGLPKEAAPTSDYVTAKGFSFNNSDATLIDESSGSMRFYTNSVLGGSIDTASNFIWRYNMSVGSAASPTATFHVIPTPVSTGLPGADLQVTSPNNTGMTFSSERIGIDFDGSAEQQWVANAYTFPVQRYMVVRQPKIAFTAADLIESYAGTVQIGGPPIASNNATINNAVTLQLTGGVVTSGTGVVNNSYALVAVAPVGASSNYSAAFLNGNVGVNTLLPTARLQILPGTATAGTAPLKILEGTLMTNPEAGAIENEGFKLMYSTSSPITRQWVSTVSNRATSNVTVSNTTTETTVYSYTISAGSLGTDKSLRLSMRGYFFNQTGSNRFIKVQVKYGTLICFTATHNMATASTPRAWHLEVEFGNDNATNVNNCYSNSKVGMANTNAGVGDVVYDELFARGSTNLDSTVDRTFSVTLTPEIASTNLYGVMDNALLEFL